MTSMTPQWHSTDEDERPVRITNVREEQEQTEEKSVETVMRAKRSPAAFVGVAIFLGIGFALFQGVHLFQAQVTDNEDDVEITITATGVDPEIAHVRPGQTILWKNESDIPHILRSDTLMDEDDEPFVSTAIFPDGEYSFEIPLTTKLETYDYISSTSTTIMGQIMVEATLSNQASSQTITQTTSSLPAGQTDYKPVITDNDDVIPQDTFTPVVQEPVVPQGGIPENPHTVGSGNVPLPPRQQPGTTVGSVTTPAVTQHKPLSTSESGMEIWVTGLMVLGALAGVTYKARRSF